MSLKVSTTDSPFLNRTALLESILSVPVSRKARYTLLSVALQTARASELLEIRPQLVEETIMCIFRSNLWISNASDVCVKLLTGLKDQPDWTSYWWPHFQQEYLSCTSEQRSYCLPSLLKPLIKLSGCSPNASLNLFMDLVQTLLHTDAVSANSLQALFMLLNGGINVGFPLAEFQNTSLQKAIDLALDCQDLALRTEVIQFVLLHPRPVASHRTQSTLIVDTRMVALMKQIVETNSNVMNSPFRTHFCREMKRWICRLGARLNTLERKCTDMDVNTRNHLRQIFGWLSQHIENHMMFPGASFTQIQVGLDLLSSLSDVFGSHDSNIEWISPSLLHNIISMAGDVQSSYRIVLQSFLETHMLGRMFDGKDIQSSLSQSFDSLSNCSPAEVEVGAANIRLIASYCCRKNIGLASLDSRGSFSLYSNSVNTPTEWISVAGVGHCYYILSIADPDERLQKLFGAVVNLRSMLEFWLPLKISDPKVLENICETAMQVCDAVVSYLTHEAPEGSLAYLEVVDDDNENNFSGLSKMSTCWRTVKEVCSVLNLLFERTVLIEQSLAVARQAGVLLLSLLHSLRHMGALAAVGAAFKTFCKNILKSNSESNRNMLLNWHREHLGNIDRKTSSTITRRSAGVPYVVSAVLTAEVSQHVTGALIKSNPNSTARPILTETMNQLFNLARRAITPVEVSENRMDLPQVHAHNILAVLIRDRELGVDLDGWIEEAFILAFQSTQSPR